MWGALLAVMGSIGAALSPSLAPFLAVHALIGVGFACLLSAGFAGVGAFDGGDRAWAMGYVVGANALAWIVVNPLAGVLIDLLSWRTAHAVPAAIALCVVASARSTPGRSATGATAVGEGLRDILSEPSARRWVGAETISFFAWGTYLTFVGAFFIERYGIAESVAGFLLALGAGMFFLASVRGASLVGRFPRPRLIAASALVMAALTVLQFTTRDMVCISLAAFFIVAAAGGIRTTVSSGLGIAQLPNRPGSMAAARTAVTMVGYLLGGLVGGATLAYSDYGAFGIVLAVGLVLCATLVSRVNDIPEREVLEHSVAARNALDESALSNRHTDGPGGG